MIKSFHVLRDGKENLEKHLKNIEFFYNNDYAELQVLNELNYKDNISQIFFQQHLKENAVK